MLKILQILLRKLQGGSASRTPTNCCPTTERKITLCVGHLSASDCGLIARGLQTALPLVAAFEQVTDADVKLLGLVQSVEGEILRIKNRDELAIRSKR